MSRTPKRVWKCKKILIHKEISCSEALLSCWVSNKKNIDIRILEYRNTMSIANLSLLIGQPEPGLVRKLPYVPTSLYWLCSVHNNTLVLRLCFVRFLKERTRLAGLIHDNTRGRVRWSVAHTELLELAQLRDHHSVWWSHKRKTRWNRPYLPFVPVCCHTVVLKSYHSHQSLLRKYENVIWPEIAHH